MKAKRADLFVATGFPKSGTTFLQRLINSHPSVSCPSEQSFQTLRRATDRMLEDYQGTLDYLDQATGGQGAPVVNESISHVAMHAVLTSLSKTFSGDKPIHGLNDNDVYGHISFYDHVLMAPKMIVIFRNAVDVADSVWRHNIRMAELDPERVHVHIGALEERGSSLEQYVHSSVMEQRRASDQFFEYARRRDNFLLVRYERLAKKTAEEAKRIFDFLGAPTDDEILKRIVDGSSREAMAKGSKIPEFFGVEKQKSRRYKISLELRAQLTPVWLSPDLKALGY